MTFHEWARKNSMADFQREWAFRGWKGALEQCALKVGDLVILKSGGPLMTIERIRGGEAQCIWFIGNQKEKENFRLVTLKKYEYGIL